MRKDKKAEKKKKLELRKETVRELSNKELEQVGGGYIAPTLTGHCYTPQG